MTTQPSAFSFQRWLTPALLGFLALVIVLLLLNLGEVDYYPGALAQPPEETDFPTQMPIGMTDSPRCMCVCGDCRHPIQDVKGRMVFRVTDDNGWYRLFWAGPTTYYYGEPASFLTALENETCRDPMGTWNVSVTFRPACRGENPVLACFSELPAKVTMAYAAVISETPPEEIDFFTDPKGRIRIPKRVVGPGRELRRNGKIVFIEWVLQGTPQVIYGPCVCPR